MSTNGDMNGWIRQAMTPKHALEAFVELLNGEDAAKHGQDATQQAAQDTGATSTGTEEPPRRRVSADAGEGRGPDAVPEAGGTANQAMNRLLREAVRNKDRA